MSVSSWVSAVDSGSDYSFGVRPDLALYFRVPIDVSLDRLMARRVKLKFYEAGMDLGLHTNPTESYKLFQGRIQEEYERIVEEYGLETMDATQPVEAQQRALRELVKPHLVGIASDPHRGAAREQEENRA